MKNRRKKLLIEPRFQIQFMLQLAGWVSLSTILTAAAACVALLYIDRRMAGDFFYITRAAGSHPTWLSLTQIILPALAVSLPLNLILTLAFGLHYSNKLAGPLHRVSQGMLKVARGEKVQPRFSLRESDEMQEVAHAFDTLLTTLSERGFLKEK